MKKVYVSATYNDLKEHREAVTRALQKMGYEVRCMENYVATDERTDKRCRADVEECDFYIGIIALRYGWIPKDSEQSITEIEYRQARSQVDRTRCLVFLLHDDAPWRQRWIDAIEDPQSASKLKRFREEFAERGAGVFRTVDDLVREVMAAIHMEDAKTWRLALQREFDICLERSRVKPIGTPSSLANGGYIVDPVDSAAPTIVQVLQTAIANANVAALIEIDLGSAGGWWSTRLLLLVSLLIDYTKVSRLVFYDTGHFVGTCGILETRRAITDYFPSVASTLAECLPQRRGFNPAADIPPIVDQFLQKLEALGGEEHVAQPVLAHVVSNFHDFNAERIELFNIRDATQRQRELIKKKYQYVALEEADSQVTIVDRLLFASRVAELTLDRI